MTGSTDTVTATVSAWWDDANSYVGIATSDPGSVTPWLVYDGLSLPDLIEGSHPNVLVVGDSADRAAAMGELVANFESSNPGTTVVRIDSPAHLAAEAYAFREHLRNYSSIGDRCWEGIRRLLVAPDLDPEKVADLASYGADLGVFTVEGWRHQVATFVTAPDVFAYRAVVESPSYRTVFALGELTWDAADGLPKTAIDAAIRGGVNDAAGVRAVVDGAPLEWALAFESGRPE